MVKKHVWKTVSILPSHWAWALNCQAILGSPSARCWTLGDGDGERDIATCSQGTDSSIDQQILHNSPTGLMGKEASCPMHSAWVPSQVLCELSANLERPRRWSCDMICILQGAPELAMLVYDLHLCNTSVWYLYMQMGLHPNLKLGGAQACAIKSSSLNYFLSINWLLCHFHCHGTTVLFVSGGYYLFWWKGMSINPLT